jgi:hypothetical protein
MSGFRASSPLPHSQSLRRRRWLFVVYALALTIGTHWPKLQIDSPLPNTDKVIHFLAFGGLAFLLWRSRWLHSLPMLLLIMLPWIALDEWSQGIPGLNRNPSMLDFVAGAAGVGAVVLFLALANRR